MLFRSQESRSWGIRVLRVLRQVFHSIVEVTLQMPYFSPMGLIFSKYAMES